MTIETIETVFRYLNETTNGSVINNSTNHTRQLTTFEIVYDVSFISVDALISILLTFFVLYYYGKKSKMWWGGFLFMGMTYFINFFSLTLISLDISTGRFSGDLQQVEDPKPYMLILWRIVYWSIQLLSWFFIPLSQSLVEQGHFNFFMKIVGAIWDNLIFYAVYIGILLAAGAGLIGVMIWQKYEFATIGSLLLGLGQTLSGAYGLGLLMYLLGDGIVSYPRYLWHLGNHKRNFKYAQFRTVTLNENVIEEKGRLSEILAEVEVLNDLVPEGDKNRKYVEKVLKTVERAEALDVRPTRTEKEVKNPTYWSIVKIHRRLLWQIRSVEKTNFEWEHHLDKAFWTQDVLDSMESKEKIITSTLRPRKPGFFNEFRARIEWFFYCKIARHFGRAAAVFFVFFTAVLLWCQIAIPIQFIANIYNVNLKLSPFYWLFFGLSVINMRVILLLFALLIMLMNAQLSLYSMFQMKIGFIAYHFIPYHTDAAALLYSAIFLCRVVPTLCFNFLQINGITDKNGIAFFNVMGVLRLSGLRFISAIAEYWEVFFPALLMLFSAFIQFFNIPARLGACVGIERFKGESMGDKQLEDGIKTLEEERRQRLKNYKAVTRTKSEEAGGARENTADRLKKTYAKYGREYKASEDKSSKKGSKKPYGYVDEELDDNL